MARTPVDVLSAAAAAEAPPIADAATAAQRAGESTSFLVRGFVDAALPIDPRSLAVRAEPIEAQGGAPERLVVPVDAQQRFELLLRRGVAHRVELFSAAGGTALVSAVRQPGQEDVTLGIAEAPQDLVACDVEVTIDVPDAVRAALAQRREEAHRSWRSPELLGLFAVSAIVSTGKRAVCAPPMPVRTGACTFMGMIAGPEVVSFEVEVYGLMLRQRFGPVRIGNQPARFRFALDAAGEVEVDLRGFGTARGAGCVRTPVRR